MRLAFVPALVNNAKDPKASVDGTFVYQRKAKSGRWIPVPTISLQSLREGDEFKLTLHADELLKLVKGLVPLYKFYESKGIPRGDKTFVELSPQMANLVNVGKKDLTGLVDARPEDAADLLIALTRWLAASSGRVGVAQKLAALAPEHMPDFGALLGLAAMKEALGLWEQNRPNASEEFWQKSLSERAYVLSQVFAYPVLIIAQKAYVGGKQISNKGGREVDFLMATESTDALILVEIKTPRTKLVGARYRDDVFPLSHELTGAIAQVLRYRQSLVQTFDSVASHSSTRFTLGEPRCFVIAGDTRELSTPEMRENFELQRDRLQGVTVITFDELFSRLQQLVTLLEEA